jgi:hypothetical protein
MRFMKAAMAVCCICVTMLAMNGIRKARIKKAMSKRRGLLGSRKAR